MLVRRDDVLYAVRARDAGVLWKRRCAKAPYAVGVGRRFLTVCGEKSLALDRHDGAILATSAVTLRTSPPQIRSARALNDRFALVDNSFGGAWSGEEYYVVDAMSAKFLWSKRNFSVVDVSAETISITPNTSTLPWAPPGTIETLRLIDGKFLKDDVYRVPNGSDTSGRGNLIVSRDATYVAVGDGPVFRFPRGSSTPQRITDAGSVATAIGGAAFINLVEPGGPTALAIDRRASSGRFVLRRLGPSSGIANGDVSEGPWPIVVGRFAAVAFADHVSLLNQRGDEIARLHTPCSHGRRVAATPSTIFVACSDRMGQAIAAYRMPH